MLKNTHIYLSISFKVGHSKLLSEIRVSSTLVCKYHLDFMKNGMSIKCPHLLDDLNYDYWKAHMIISSSR